MSQLTEIKEKIAHYAAMLDMQSSISITTAEKKAAEFLVILAEISHWKHLLSDEKIKLSSILSVTYHQELSKCTGKTVTENKIAVEATNDYITSRENLESIDNDISYLKAMYDVFNNGHLFYRQLSKTNT